MPRKNDEGIEIRTGADGVERYRGYIREPNPDGKGTRKVPGPWTASKPDAKAWRVRAMNKKLDGVLVKPPAPVESLLLSTALDRWIKGVIKDAILNKHGTKFSPKTKRDYERIIRDYITPVFGNVPVDQLRRKQVNDWIEELNLLLAGSTVRNIVHVLSSYYTYRFDIDEEMDYDPTRRLKLPPAGDPSPMYADDTEIPLLLTPLAFDPELVIPWAIAFFAGLRNGEIRALPLDLIDLDARRITVEWSIDSGEGFKGPKTGAGTRPVPIFPPLIPYLELLLSMRGPATRRSTEDRPGTPAFPALRADNQWGVREFGSPFYRKCRKAWADAGVDEDLRKMGLHAGRHSFATAMFRSGKWDVKQISEWIGHSEASTTANIYAKARGRFANFVELSARMDASDFIAS